MNASINTCMPPLMSSKTTYIYYPRDTLRTCAGGLMDFRDGSGKTGIMRSFKESRFCALSHRIHVSSCRHGFARCDQDRLLQPGRMQPQMVFEASSDLLKNFCACRWSSCRSPMYPMVPQVRRSQCPRQHPSRRLLLHEAGDVSFFCSFAGI